MKAHIVCSYLIFQTKAVKSPTFDTSSSMLDIPWCVEGCAEADGDCSMLILIEDCWLNNEASVASNEERIHLSSTSWLLP